MTEEEKKRKEEQYKNDILESLVFYNLTQQGGENEAH